MHKQYEDCKPKLPIFALGADGELTATCPYWEQAPDPMYRAWANFLLQKLWALHVLHIRLNETGGGCHNLLLKGISSTAQKPFSMRRFMKGVMEPLPLAVLNLVGLMPKYRVLARSTAAMSPTKATTKRAAIWPSVKPSSSGIGTTKPSSLVRLPPGTRANRIWASAMSYAQAGNAMDPAATPAATAGDTAGAPCRAGMKAEGKAKSATAAATRAMHRAINERAMAFRNFGLCLDVLSQNPPWTATSQPNQSSLCVCSPGRMFEGPV